uniref:Uncharacterized protein n=1 Tax=Ananas comosus var. bracteatus TaxID=296719 RepID=A0A6V7PV84_ANACO|nr:unnamed protein product [Ananas comosus var. bracteatus]
MGPVSPRENAFGDRSHPSGTGCLRVCRDLSPMGQVSPFRDRSPRVKTLRTARTQIFRAFQVGTPSTTFHQVWKSSEPKSNTRTSQFAQLVHCLSYRLDVIFPLPVDLKSYDTLVIVAIHRYANRRRLTFAILPYSR